MNNFIFKSTPNSSQISRDTEVNNIIEPFFSFDTLLGFHYSNVYHRRAIKIKAGMLSQIEVDESDLMKFIGGGISAKAFLFEFCYNLELYGNAPIEKAGSANFALFNIPAHEWRTNKKREIFQIDNEGLAHKLDGFYFKYYSPSSRYYGEPDYLSALSAILINKQADEYNSAFFSNGARPDLAIIHENSEPNEEQIKAYKEFFSSNFKGSGNAHKTLLAYTGGNINEKDAHIRFEKLGGVDDLSFANLKKVSRDEIALAHGIPPRLLGIMDAGGLGGSGELIGQLQQFNEIEIKPKIELIEGFFENIGIKVCLKALDVTNFKDDGSIVTTLVSTGIISVDEARSILGWQKNI